jgi:single-strand DNA-binding protein
MMDINNCTIVGRLTADPELRTVGSDKKVVDITVANNTGYGDNQRTAFIKCTAWGKTAEAICRYCHKGALVAIAGSILQNSWTDQEGKKRNALYILIDDIQFLSPQKQTDSVADTKRDLVTGIEVVPGFDDIPF